MGDTKLASLITAQKNLIQLHRQTGKQFFITHSYTSLPLTLVWILVDWDLVAKVEAQGQTHSHPDKPAHDGYAPQFTHCGT